MPPFYFSPDCLNFVNDLGPIPVPPGRVPLSPKRHPALSGRRHTLTERNRCTA
jgi:hypothetical protein